MHDEKINRREFMKLVSMAGGVACVMGSAVPFLCAHHVHASPSSKKVIESGGVLKNPGDYFFCHRCGMAIKKSEYVMIVSGVPEEPWYQCCPMCALMDIIECGKGSGTITAYCDTSFEKIEIIIMNRALNKVSPDSALIHVGGSCMKNKIFSDREKATMFILKHSWASQNNLKTVSRAVSLVTSKKRAIERCAMCTTELKGHEKTWFTIITKKKKRMVACCAHCGLFMMYKLKDRAKRAVTPDFKTGRLINAKQAHYVVDNKLVVCCVPSTMSFEKVEDARDFQNHNGGEIMTFQEVMANIHKLMKR